MATMENVLCGEDIDAILTVIENDVVTTSFNAEMVKVLISKFRRKPPSSRVPM